MYYVGVDIGGTFTDRVLDELERSEGSGFTQIRLCSGARLICGNCSASAARAGRWDAHRPALGAGPR